MHQYGICIEHFKKNEQTFLNIVARRFQKRHHLWLYFIISSKSKHNIQIQSKHLRLETSKTPIHTPFLGPVNSWIIHFVDNHNQLWYTQCFSKLNMLTGLPTSLISSFKLSFSSRYNLRCKHQKNLAQIQMKIEEANGRVVHYQHSNISLGCTTYHVWHIILMTL